MKSKPNQVLLCRILDSIYINARDCITLQGIQGPVQLLSLRVKDKAEVTCPNVQMQRHGAVLCFTLLIKVHVCLLKNGQTQEYESCLRLPLCKSTHLRPDQNPDFTVQCQLQVRRCCERNGALQIETDIHAILYATCLCVSALPQPPLPREDFDIYCQLPLYPGMLPSEAYYPFYPYS